MKITERIEGAVYGALIAGILGQIPPFTAIPEEVISLPIGAVVGALIGKKGITKVVPKVF